MATTVKPAVKQTAIGELRQDLVTGKWVAIAPNRKSRPHSFTPGLAKVDRLPKYKNDCPFCNLADFPQDPDVLRLPDDPDTWQVHIFGNKYPAFVAKDDLRSWQVGPYRVLEAVGYHELLAPRWHNQIDVELTTSQQELQIAALLTRYQQLKVKSSVNYIQIIKNVGPDAGASIEHPHHQIFTTPVLPSDVNDALLGAERYAREHHHSPFVDIVAFEIESGDRIIWENDAFIVFCPFASRVPYAMWVLPKQPSPFFENLTPVNQRELAEALQQALRRLIKVLPETSYNYIIHSAPCDETGFVCNLASFQHFCWYVEILPRQRGSFAGFELGTGLEIVSTVPEEAARQLREATIGHVAN